MVREELNGIPCLSRQSMVETGGGGVAEGG